MQIVDSFSKALTLPTMQCLFYILQKTKFVRNDSLVNITNTIKY